MDEMILETKRLVLRKLEQSDFREACKLLQDPEVMYAYEGPLVIRKFRYGWTRCFGGTRMTVSLCGRLSRRVAGSLSGNVASRIKNITGDGCRKSVICSGKNFGIKDLPQRQLLLVKSMLFRFWILMMFIPLFEIRTWPPRMWHDETE